MRIYWKDYHGHDESFWAHEWNAHGTCVSTLEPRCYADGLPEEGVVDFFNKTIELFNTLPSYDVTKALDSMLRP